ncbi:hypothetical protein Tco_0101755, partial [Tanacetum coccineum]
DDDDGDSSGDDTNDEDEDEGDEEEEEEEHPAPADSAIIVPTVEPVSPPEASISLPQEAKVERLLAMPTPSPSPPISLSPPSIRERLIRCTPPPAHSSPPPVPSSLPPSSGDDLPEFELPPRKRLCLSTSGSRYEIGKSYTARTIEGRGTDYRFVSTMDAEARRQGISEVGYGIRDTWVDPAEAVSEVAPMNVGEVNTRVTELAELYEHDTRDLYALLGDAQDGRTRISQRVAMDSQQVDLLMGDRMTLQKTIWMLEEE